MQIGSWFSDDGTITKWTVLRHLGWGTALRLRPETGLAKRMSTPNPVKILDVRPHLYSQ